MKDSLWTTQVTCSSQGKQIMKKYQTWIQEKQIEDEVIVRSSGVLEDNYGHAQAGVYDSKRCQLKKDCFIQTLLQVLASGITTQNISTFRFQPMAVIIQQYMTMQSGGVGFSCASLTDLSFQITIAKGSLSATDSGIGESLLTQSTCLLSRDDTNFYIPYLTNENQYKLKNALCLLESALMCPVDVEFGEDQDAILWILQARPVTKLGAIAFQVSPELQRSPYATGIVCSEGLGIGSLYYMDDNHSTDILNIPEKAIVFARKGYEIMLQSAFLEKIAGLMIPSATSTSHLAIQCSQYHVPLMSNLTIPNSSIENIIEEELKAMTGQPMTLMYSDINQKPHALLWRDDQTAHITQIATQITLNLPDYQAPTYRDATT